MDKRPSKDEYYLRIAEVLSLRAPCIRRRYGAIVVKDDVIVATGYNGSPRGVINCIEVGCLKDKMGAPHGSGYEWCLPPQQEVLTNQGPIPISKIKRGDYILTHSGKNKKVTQVFRRFYKGAIIDIKPWGLLPVAVTPEHPVLAMRTRRCQYSPLIICKETCKWFHKSHCKRFYEAYTFEWIPAKDIKKDDILLLPFSNTSLTLDEIDLSFIEDPPSSYQETLAARKNNKSYGWIEKNLNILPSTAYGWIHGKIPRNIILKRNEMLYHGSSEGKPIPAKIKITKEFLRLVGFYLSEGCVSKNQVIFTFNKQEKNLVEEVKDGMRKLFRLNCYEYIPKNKNSHKIVFSSVVLAKIFSEFFGKDCYSKHIPSFLMSLDPKQQSDLLNAYVAGDGYITKDGEIRAVTASKTLALQLVQMLLRIGYVPTIDSKLRKKRAKSIIYRVIWKRRKFTHAYIKGSFLFVPVEKIKKKKYSGDVYNLEVEDENSYTTSSFVVHNCIAVHAEENVIINAARTGASVLGGVMYIFGRDAKTGEICRAMPCERCKRAIINAGIKEVVMMDKNKKIERIQVADWIKEQSESYRKSLES